MVGRAMRRCCEGETYARPEGDRMVTERGMTDAALPPRHLDTSWAVCCFDCGAVLALVNGVEREEVYAEL